MVSSISPIKRSDDSYAFDASGEPYDFNGDGLIENLIADPNNTNEWFHSLVCRAATSTFCNFSTPMS